MAVNLSRLPPNRRQYFFVLCAVIPIKFLGCNIHRFAKPFFMLEEKLKDMVCDDDVENKEDGDGDKGGCQIS